MTDEERRTTALDHSLAAKKALDQAEVEPDPVAQRRLQVIAGRHYLQAWVLLTDGGRL